MVKFGKYLKRFESSKKIQREKAMIFCPIDDILDVNENNSENQYDLLVGLFHVISKEIFDLLCDHHRLDGKIIKKEAICMFGKKPDETDKKEMLRYLEWLKEAYFMKSSLEIIMGELNSQN